MDRGGQGPADPRPHPRTSGPHLRGQPWDGPSRAARSTCPSVLLWLHFLLPSSASVVNRRHQISFRPLSRPCQLTRHMFSTVLPPAGPGQAWTQERGRVIAAGRQTYLSCKGNKSYGCSMMLSECGAGGGRALPSRCSQSGGKGQRAWNVGVGLPK